MQKPRRKTRPGQTDIANVLGVSVSTVSRALAGSPLINTDIRRQVEEVAVQLGYPLRQRLEHEHFDNIVVLTAIGGFNDARSSVYYSLLEGIREEAARCSPHIETAIMRSGQPIPHEVNRRLTPRTGCIYLGVTPTAETARDLVSRQIPCVVSNGIDEELIVDSVAPANFVGGKLMARHLMEHGHRRFLYLAGVNRSTLRRRLAGFRQQLEDSAPDGSAGLVSIFQGQGNMSEQAFDRFLTWIEKERKDATALFCFNDGAAVWAVEAIKSLGLSVPGDISVVGFDDMPVAQVCSPALTTFRIDWVQIGRQTVQLLHERLRDPERDAQLLQIGGKLIVRSSVADIR